MVDDHPLIRDGLRAALRRALPEVRLEEAGNPKDALERARSQVPQIVLLDVHLPGMSGVELARRLKSADPKVRILMIAGEADPWTIREALEAGAAGFIAKTRTAESLYDALRAVLDGGQYLCLDSRAALATLGDAEHSSRSSVEPGPSILTDREREILRLLAVGENTKAIAATLKISPKTVETHRSHLMRKLHVDNVAGLTRYAIRHGLTTL